MGLGLSVAAILCARSARPRRFWIAGANPKNWWDEHVEDKSLAACLHEESLNYRNRITKNEKILDANAIMLYRGLRLGVVSPIFGLLAAAAAAALY